MPLRVIDYGNEFHVYWSFDQWHKRNLDAVKALHPADRRYVVDNKKGNRYWWVHNRQRSHVEAWKETHRAEIILPETLKPEEIGQLPEMAELSITIPYKDGVVPRPYQNTGVAQAMKLKRCLIGDEQGLGKAQPLYSRIATPSGWVKMGDIAIGQEVFGSDGKIYNVSGIHPQGFRSVFKVTFNDGYSAECDLEHIWTVRDQNRRRRGNGWTNKTTRELLEQGLDYKTNQKRIDFGGQPILKWEIPLSKAIEFKEKNYKIHPYVMGMLLGDGSICGKSICISIPDSQIESVKRIEECLPKNIKLKVNRHPACPQYYFTQTGTTKKNPFKAAIEQMGVNVKGLEKFIPIEYLHGSVDQRKELLIGLMDSDGSANKNRITYHTCSKKLAESVVELVQSLGGIGIIRTYDRGPKGIEFQVNVRVDFNPFKILSKAANWKVKKRGFASRYIKSIEVVGKMVECQCISVTAPNHLYLTDNYIVTHNTLQSIGTVIGLEVQGFNSFPCLVVCPSSTKLNWQREFHKFSNKRAMVLDSSLSAQKKKNWFSYVENGMIDVVIVNYESLSTFCVESFPNEKTKTGKRKPWKSIDVKLKPFMSMFKSGILDESHRCKDSGTNQSKFIMRIFSTLEYRYLLSGTPVVNKPVDLFAQLAIMGQLNNFGGRDGFLKRYCEGGTGSSNLKELNYKMNLHCFFRREKKDVAKDLPEKLRQTILCDITTRHEYNKCKQDFEQFLIDSGMYDDESIARRMRGEIMTKMMQLKQISAKGKMNEVKEFVNEVLESGEKLILFMHLHEIVDECKKLWPDAVTVTGRDGMEQRQRNIDAFQNNPNCNLIICNHKAAGVGITLTASSRVAFIEYPWTYADCVQCEDRAHRIGAKNTVMCTYFLGDDTVDERMWELISEKMSIGNTITGASDMMEMEMVDKTLTLFKRSK